MKIITLIIGILISITLFSQNNEEWLRKSSIVFTGSIESMHSSSQKDINENGVSCVVKIQNVHLKPDAVSMPKSGFITVVLNTNEDIKEGGQFTFYSNGIIFGNELTVKEIGHSVASPVSKKMFQEKKDLLLIDHLEKADYIGVGKVIEIRKPTDDMKPSISEHNPKWMEAIVMIEKSFRGPEANKIIVRFPSSNDIAWHRIPKLKENQEVLFILRTDKMITGLKEGLIEAQRAYTYVLTDEMDVLAKDEISRVENLLKQ